jgi:hypothetical protein
MSTEGSFVADFYVGRGENATYLGTSTWPVDPIPTTHFQSLDANEFTMEDFRLFVGNIVTSREWPHSYADSTETPWTYAYDTGSVYVYRYGVEMAVIRCNAFRWVKLHDGVGHGRDWRPVNNFPTMKEATSA